MAGPPEDVPPSELFLKLQERPFPSEVVPFPRRTEDGKPLANIRLKVLTETQQQAARIEGQREAERIHKLSRQELDTPVGQSLISDMAARQVLWKASLAEENRGSEEKPFYPYAFPNADAIGNLLSTDEVAVLYQCWRMVQSKWGPSDKTIDSEQELSAWIKRLTEGAAEFPLQQLSSVHWADAASLLAVRAYTLSAILESLFSILPPTLQSRLTAYSLGTGFFGTSAPKESPAGTETSLSLRVADVEITIEDAQAFIAKMRAAESGALAALDAAEVLRD